MIDKIRYLYKFFKLVIHAGLVWGIKEVDVPSFVERIKQSPLKYEFEDLEKERFKLFGTRF